jgi:hypothetical protein
MTLDTKSSVILPFIKKHFKDPVSENLFQVLCLKVRRYPKQLLPIKTAVRTEDVQMGIEAENIIKRLNGSKKPENPAFFREASLKKELQ